MRNCLSVREWCQGAVHLQVMDSILPIGSASKGNNYGVLPPGHKALGAGQGISEQLQAL